MKHFLEVSKNALGCFGFDPHLDTCYKVIPGRMTLLITIFLVLINIFNTIQTNSPQVDISTLDMLSSFLKMKCQVNYANMRNKKTQNFAFLHPIQHPISNFEKCSVVAKNLRGAIIYHRLCISFQTDCGAVNIGYRNVDLACASSER